MPHSAVVFLSCGQRPGERELAREIQQMIEREFKPMKCYNADSRQGFEDVMSITEHLARSDYYLFIDFKRDDSVPISVFTHQEFALARAWQIEEMLAFQEKGLQEKGLSSHGMLGYVLAHPTQFERATLVEQVRKEIARKDWNANYSRNLLADRIEASPAMRYGYPNGEVHGEEIWRVFIENRRIDQAAWNTIAILDSVTSNETVRKPDRTFLKWAGQQAYQKTVFPQDYGEIDAFAIRVDGSGVFLHSARDLYLLEAIITEPGFYKLKYLLYAPGFPSTDFTIAFKYAGPQRSTASLE
jgi:hypothetical protein